MLGDSAVVKNNGTCDTSSADKACKVRYLRKANIGLAIWGIRSIGDEKSDEILGQFVDSHEQDYLELEECGSLLASLFNSKLDKAGHTGSDREGGIHLCGYINQQPKLWHVHWSATENQGLWGLARDIPESKDIAEDVFMHNLQEGSIAQLSNGFYKTLDMARQGLFTYSKLLMKEKNLRFPEDTVEGHILYARTMFLMVSAAIQRSREPCYVDENIRMIVFDKIGLERPIMQITISQEAR